MDDKKPAINLGVAVSACLLTAVLVAEERELLVAIPDKGPSYNAPPLDTVGPHLHQERSDAPVNTNITAPGGRVVLGGMPQAVPDQPPSFVFPTVGPRSTDSVGPHVERQSGDVDRQLTGQHITTGSAVPSA